MEKTSNTKIANPRDISGFLLWQSANKWEKYVNSHLKELGLNQSENFHLLSINYLTKSGEGLTQIGLSLFTGVTSMSVSKILKKLETQKIIKRTTGKDSRSKNLKLTEKGQEITIQATEILNNADKLFFPSKDKQLYIDYLARLESY
jgi:DNA-binding MarR family transcriptional regulator